MRVNRPITRRLNEHAPHDTALRSEQFLKLLASSEKPLDARRLSIVVAHPDDETLGCGAQLSRLIGAMLIVVTDGAPDDLADAMRAGLSTRSAYAELRARELRNALQLCGASVDLLMMGVRDQAAGFALSRIASSIASELARRRTGIVLTHAYEGGHPDHDAASFVAHASAALLSRRGLCLEVIEMPFYRARTSGLVRQAFLLPRGSCVTEIALSESAAAVKQGMVRAHSSQAWLLEQFDLTRERFRVAPRYTFQELPNEGALLYEQHPWGMSAAQWLELVRGAQRELEVTLPCR